MTSGKRESEDSEMNQAEEISTAGNLDAAAGSVKAVAGSGAGDGAEDQAIDVESVDDAEAGRLFVSTSKGKGRDNRPSSIYVDLESSVYMLDEDAIWGEDIPTYAPPQPSDSAMYTEENHERIVPVSHLLLEKRVAQEISKYDDWGRMKEEIPQFEQVKMLPADTRYDATRLASPLFGKLVDERPVEEISRPTQPRPAAVSANPTPAWTAEEDEAVFTLAKMYQFNWDLVVDSLHSTRAGLVARRSAWDCFGRYRELVAQGYRSDRNGEGSTKVPKSPVGRAGNSRPDAEKREKMHKHLGTFETIRKCAKRRDMKVAQLEKKLGTTSMKINLIAHETHLTAQTQVGVDIHGRPLSPFELSLLRERREKELRQAQDPRHHPMHAGYGRLPQSLGRPGMPVQHGQHVPLPHQYGHFRPAPRPPNGTSGPLPNGAAGMPSAGAPMPIRPPSQLPVGAQLPSQPNMTMPRPNGTQAGMGAGMKPMLTPQMMAQRGGMGFVPQGQMHMSQLGDPSSNGQVSSPGMSPQFANMAQRVQMAQAQQAKQLHMQHQAMQHPQVRHQMSNDAQAAAAMVALGNAQQAVKLGQNSK
ncbi:hypothetical protein HK104_000547 [Borealophlyctis nickersoniae]|nr:hypothetical protein HK104_000547 [Borealophlyctis nickersoniae]